MSRGYRHRVSICPGCGHRLNASSDPKDRGMPRPGDLSLCIDCGTILRFDWQLRLKVVTPEEIEKLPKRTALELLEQKDRWLAYHGQGKTRIVVPGGLKQ
jgi:hypothetical protein